MATPSVIVFGASGNVGKFVLPALIKSGVQVTVASRPSSTAKFSSDVKVVKPDLESLDELTSAIRGHEVVISLVGSAAVKHEELVIDAAVAAGAKYFIPSEFGHDTEDERIWPLLSIFSTKREIAAYLRGKEKDGLSWTSLITALFFDWGLAFGMFDVNFKEAKANVWDGGDVYFSAANKEDIADAVVRLVTDPATREEYKNQFVYVSSVYTTQNEIIAAAEAVTGKKFELSSFDSETAFKMGSPLQILKAIQMSNRRLADYQARVASGQSKFIVNRKADVKDTVKALLAP